MNVAVVGSSGNLLNTHYGERIDACDAVMRFNDAPVKGFEEYVGQRTTHRFICYPCTNWDFESTLEDENIYMISSSHQKLVEGIRKVFRRNNVHRITAGYDAMISKPSIRRMVYQYFGADYTSIYRKLASMGFTGIMYALKNFGEVELYGFDFYAGAKKHYWNEVTTNYNKWHDWKKEKQIIKRLEDEGKLKIF